MGVALAIFALAGQVVALPPLLKDTRRVQHGLSTVYWPGDGMSGKECADGKRFTATRCHLAHRTWPLGRRVRICSLRTGKCAFTFVGDRGPFGACDSRGMNPRTFACRGQWFVKIRPGPEGRWRGITDLSRCVWRQIGGGPIMQLVRLELLAPEKPPHDTDVPHIVTLPESNTPQTLFTVRTWAWEPKRYVVLRLP